MQSGRTVLVTAMTAQQTPLVAYLLKEGAIFPSVSEVCESSSRGCHSLCS